MNGRVATIVVGAVLLATHAAFVEAQQPRETDEAVKANGTLEPAAVVEVSPQVNGAIVGFGSNAENAASSVDFGCRVQKGMVLVEIDPAIYRIELDRAKAGMIKAEADLQAARAKLDVAKLNSQQAMKGVVDKSGDDLAAQAAHSELDVAAAEVARSEADIELSKAVLSQVELNLDRCKCRSPVDGVVIARRCELGQNVSPATTPSAFLIASDLKKMQLWLSVGERNIGKISVGEPVKFTVAAFPDRRFSAKVVQIRPNAESVQNSVFYTVVADVDQVDGKLLPYMTAEAEIVTDKHLADR